jgi:acyl-[acyl carrier protein]--UDP-N-acetylglucosamine O-acyltransferase
VFTGALIKLSELAVGLELDVVRDCDVAYVAKIPSRLDARLVFATKPSHVQEMLEQRGIAGALVPAAIADLVPSGLGLAISAHPLSVAMELHDKITRREEFQWRSFATLIDSSANVHPTAIIAANDVVIGAGTSIGPYACIEGRTLIGANCSIGAHCVIGTGGFDTRPATEPRRLIDASGGVIIGDNVTILAGTTIDRASFGGFTEIGSETLIDKNVYIAHDCVIGARVTMTSGTRIMGRVEVADGCYFGPGAVIANGLSIGAAAYVTMGAVVTRNVPAGERVSGNFAVPHARWLDFIKTLVRG